MNHDDQTPSDRPASTPPRRRAPGRVLAITGLALALVPCCPFTGLTGVLLGAFALRSMRLAGLLSGDADAETARTRRFAFAAIGVGAVSALVWSASLSWLQRAQDAAQERAMTAQVATFLDAAIAGDEATALAAWSESASDRPDEEDVAEFGRVADERYGEFERFSIISTAQSGSLLSRAAEVAGVFHFEDESPLGSARFALSPGGLVPRFDLTYLSIEDRARGNLTLGPGEDPSN